MKKLFYGLIIALILLPITMLGACGEEKITTTVMVYMCGSNLESDNGLATKDILEMQSSDFDMTHTNLFLMTGGAEEWDMPSIDADMAQIRQVSPKGMRIVWKGDSMNMGKSETLSFFLNKVTESSDTDRYILILWDHGAGPLKGVCRDENYGNDSLSMFELRNGLENSPFAGRRLDIIGFDACLMSSLETAWLVSPYAEYMVASAEQEPGSGWDYHFLNGLEADQTPVETGKRIIDAYIGSFPEDCADALTLSMIDLDCIDEVVREMSAFFSRINGTISDSVFQNISVIRYGTLSYGRDYRIVDCEDFDLVDIYSLMNACGEHDFAGGEALLSALDKAIVVTGTNLENVSGLSVYFPYRNRREYSALGADFLKKTQFCPGYVAFVDDFQVYLHGEATVDWKKLTPEITRQGDGFAISLSLTEKQLEDMISARLIVLEADSAPDGANTGYVKIFGVSDVMKENGALSAEYGGESLIFSYSDTKGGLHETGPIEFIVLDTGEYQLDVLASNLTDVSQASYDDPGVSHMMRLTLYPPDENGFARLKSYQVYDSAVNRFTTRTGDTIENYKYLYFNTDLRYITREDGLLLPYDAWSLYREEPDGPARTITIGQNAVIGPAAEWGFRVQKDYGVRYAAFEITDSRNNTFLTEIVPIRPLSEITLYHQDVTIEDMPLEAELRVVAAAPDRTITWISFTNRSESTAYVFEGRDICINGQRVDSYSQYTADWDVHRDSGDGGYVTEEDQPYLILSNGIYWAAAAPGETVCLYVRTDLQLLLEELRTGHLITVSMDIDVIDASTRTYAGTIEGVTLAPNVFLPDVYRNYR